jgi:hypothetical protein
MTAIAAAVFSDELIRLRESAWRRDPREASSGVETTDRLLATLRTSGTDLARLIETCECRRSPRVYVSGEALASWEKRAPGAWALAHAWFVAHGVTIVVI